jgi:hypothetical protein
MWVKNNNTELIGWLSEGEAWIKYAVAVKSK